MLFEKKMDPRCSYCSRSARLDDETVMCIKKGVVPAGYHCRGFQYDLSALFVGLLARLFPLEAPVSSYLADQVESLSALDFSTALTISTVCAWVLWLLFFTAALAAVRKTSRKRRKAVL